jgi:LysR family transcriptional regulator, hydrogen peroxide-inducible genes activator
MVELNGGITVLPKLATLVMTVQQKNHLRYFQQPTPVREVSIITHRDFTKCKLTEELKKRNIKCGSRQIKKD